MFLLKSYDKLCHLFNSYEKILFVKFINWLPKNLLNTIGKFFYTPEINLYLCY